MVEFVSWQNLDPQGVILFYTLINKLDLQGIDFIFFKTGDEYVIKLEPQYFAMAKDLLAKSKSQLMNEPQRWISNE